MKNKYLKISSISFLTLLVLSSTFFILKYFGSFKNTKLTPDPTTYKGKYGLNLKIDTTIKQIKNSDYQYANTTNRFYTYFKSNLLTQDAIKYEKNGSSLSFFTPVDQSFGELVQTNPTTSKNTITYPDIYPGLDVSYTVKSTKLIEEFIIKSKELAPLLAEIKQIATTQNISSFTVENDAIVFKNGDSKVIILPKPVMYEQSDRSKESYGLKYDIQQDGDRYIIKKIITDEGLAWIKDPSRSYPLIIDPVVIDNSDPIDSSIDSGDSAASWTSSDSTNTTVSQETTLKQEGTGSLKVQTATTGSITLDLMEYANNAAAQSAFVTSTTTTNGTGGTITTSGGNTIHTFTTSGTFTPPAAINVAALVVAGGGGGGSKSGSSNAGGGGGGGGVQYNASYAASAATTVTIGNGGSGGVNTSEAASNGSNGGNSVFGTITANGGGGGGGISWAGGGIGLVGKAGGNGGGGGGGQTPAGGTGSQGYAGGAGSGTISASGWWRGGGGGGGGSVGQTGDSSGNGGIGYLSSISGVSTYYAGGGGGGRHNNGTVGYNAGTGGSGGGANGGYTTTGYTATSNTGGGGGGSGCTSCSGGAGGSGIVIVSYPTPPYLQSYSESTIKTQGTYALKGIANITTSANQTLTSTIGSPINLSDATNVTFDIRSTRTGSNLKIGLRDSGGTVTEVTPNITVANAFQTVTVDLTGVTNTNKDAINQIIVTVVEATAANTFYIDNMLATIPLSINDSVTKTIGSTDLSSIGTITYWVRSSVAGSFASLGIGETSATEQTTNITISSPNTWEQKTWDISGITPSARNAITKLGLTFTGNTTGAAFYLDDIRGSAYAWVSSDPANTTVTRELSVTHSGTGSTKIQTGALAYTNLDLMEYSSNATAQSTYVSNSLYPATGGTITSTGGYTLHTFTSSGTFTPSVTITGEVLVVAGGGGGAGGGAGATSASGGGAGGLVYQASRSLTQSVAYTATVGLGGNGGAASNVDASARGQTGQNSVFDTITALGGGAGSLTAAPGTGGSGGGGQYTSLAGASATQGNSGGGTGFGSAGGAGSQAAFAYGAGGGGGAGGVGTAGNGSIGGAGGIGKAYFGTTYATGGQGGWYAAGSVGTPGAANTGNGGGGANTGSASSGGAGGSGIVIVRYPDATPLQSYSESTIKTQGTYSLKGIAAATSSLNKTLTRTIGAPVNLSNYVSASFSIRSTRTGSNIKVGIRDSGGTVTEVTPNIAVADTFQTATIDLSGVTNANKDAIDSIIITIVNASAINTFYLDNLVAANTPSLDDTVTLTVPPTDLSTASSLSIWVRSTVAGSFAQMEFGEVASSEQSNSFTISAPNTWEQKTWDISGITASSRNAVTKFALRITGDTSAGIIYLDDLASLTPPLAPTIGTGTAQSSSVIRWSFTDNSSDETGFKVYDTSNNLVATCATANLSYCDESGLTTNTSYIRKVVAYNADGNSSYTSNSAAVYTLAVVPTPPTVSNRLSTSISVNPNPSTNPVSTTFAIYKEVGTTCDGSGGSYIAANGSDNGSTAVWQTDSAWSTVSATGLSSESIYTFCVKARNGDNLETAFSDIANNNAGIVPLGGDFPCQDSLSINTLTTRYPDGNNPGRYIVGVDTGSSNTNTAKFDIKPGCTLAMNSTDTLVVGTLDMTGGSITNIGSGAKIVVGQPLWIIDADGDGFSSDGKVYYGNAPANGRRKSLAGTLSALDCGDSQYSLANSCCTVATRYQDADGDTYGNPSVSISACPTAGYVDNNTDCYDGNANAKPGSTTCSSVNRGDGSFDYNCSSTQTTCGTPAYSTTYYDVMYGCWNSADRICNNFCVWNPNSVITSQKGCGVVGNLSSGSVVSSGDVRCPWSYTIASGSTTTQACQ